MGLSAQRICEIDPSSNVGVSEVEVVVAEKEENL